MTLPSLPWTRSQQDTRVSVTALQWRQDQLVTVCTVAASVSFVYLIALFTVVYWWVVSHHLGKWRDCSGLQLHFVAVVVKQRGGENDLKEWWPHFLTLFFKLFHSQMFRTAGNYLNPWFLSSFGLNFKATWCYGALTVALQTTLWELLVWIIVCFWGKSHCDQSVSVWRCKLSVQLGSSKWWSVSVRAQCGARRGQLGNWQRPALVPLMARLRRQALTVNGDSVDFQAVHQNHCWWVDVIDCFECRLRPAKVMQKAVPESTRSRTPVASG